MREQQRARRARLKSFEKPLQEPLPIVKNYVKNTIKIPEVVKKGITTDVSVLRAFHLFLLKKHHRGPKTELIDNLIFALEELKKDE